MPRLALLAVLSVVAAHAGGFEPALRGAYSVALRHDGGPLRVVVSKCDLNLYDGADELHLALTDPLRRSVGTAVVADDGVTGKGARTTTPLPAELLLPAAPAGVYRLLVSGSAQDVVWGLETSAARFVLEGQPLCSDPSAAGVLAFQPPAGAFEIIAAALHRPGLQVLRLSDAAGKLVYAFPVDQAGLNKDTDLFGPRSKGGFEAGEKYRVEATVGDRSGLWTMPVRPLDVRLVLGGVKSWTIGPANWFDADAARWLLLPYRTVRYAQPGAVVTLPLELRRSQRAGEVALRVSAPAGWSAELPASLTLKPGAPARPELRVNVPAGVAAGGSHDVIVSAAVAGEPDAQASALLTVKIGDSPVGQPLAGPLVLRRYEHEDVQYGYAPDYVANEVYFDLRNRPWIRWRNDEQNPTRSLTTWAGGGWVERDFTAALRAAWPDFRGTYYGAGFQGAKVAFDDQGGCYTLLRILVTGRSLSVLLFTPDEGRTWQVLELPGGGFDIEQFTGHNPPAGPPALLTVRMLRDHPATYAEYNELLLWLPRRVGERLELGPPVALSDSCVGMCQHSGGPASLQTRAGRTHVAWGEIAPDDAPGVPTWIATVDHATRQVVQKTFVGHAPPVNDVHNVPGVCLDSQGYLHVVTGAHGEPFTYRRSVRPNDLRAGLTPVETVLSDDYREPGQPPRGRQTYLSLVCGPDDTLHLACRQWRMGVDPHHAPGYYAALSYQSRPAGGRWSAARPLVVPPCPNYSIWYHKLTIDRAGRLFLSYNNWSQDATYQDDFPERYTHRAVISSADGGKTWRLARTSDLLPPP
ncbi:MAG: BNR-4 repeat-containing protein [Fimbriimonadaceae bacterium]|nr:BNR-4 repeat-containing protein [Fimbriimonadaceae bacterium]